MNGGAYGGDFAQVLERALVATADGTRLAHAGGARPLVPALGPPPRPGRRRGGAAAPAARPRTRSRRRSRELNARRKAAQPTNRRTFGSVFKNPEHELTRGADARGVRAEGPPDRRRADLAEARELHRERRRRPHRRRARADGARRAAARTSSTASSSARGRAPRRRSSCRRSGRSGPAARRTCAGWPASVDARRPVAARARGRRDAAARAAPSPALAPASRRRGARSLVGLGARSRSRAASTSRRVRRSAFAVGRVEVAGAPAERPGAGAARGRAARRHEPARARRRRARAPGRGAADRRLRRATTAPSRTRCASTSCRRCPVAVLHRGKETWLVSARGRVDARASRPDVRRRSPRIWVPRATPVAAGAIPRRRRRAATAARALALATRFPARIATASLAHGELVFRLRSGLELRLGEPTDLRLKLAIARRALARLPGGRDVPRRQRARAARSPGTDPQLSGRG